MARSEAYRSMFMHKTHEIPRPTGNEERWRRSPDAEVLAAQEAWDIARQQHDHAIGVYARIAAKAAQEEADRRAKDVAFAQQQREKSDAAILTPAWQAFQSAGGTEEEFQANREAILTQARMAIALNAANTATTEMQPRPNTSLYRG
jgi:hypothetical protein